MTGQHFLGYELFVSSQSRFYIRGGLGNALSALEGKSVGFPLKFYSILRSRVLTVSFIHLSNLSLYTFQIIPGCTLSLWLNAQEVNSYCWPLDENASFTGANGIKDMFL